MRTIDRAQSLPPAVDRVWTGLMSERFQLMFRGEILDGQHKAVVKKRLAQLLNIVDDRVQGLFAGEPVVIKKDVDRATAARYQDEFKKAGARLRVTGDADAAADPADTPSDVFSDADASGEDPTIADPGAMMSDADDEPPPAAPDTSHLSVAETGSDLLEEEHRAEEVVLDVDPDFDLAAPGADMGQITTEAMDVEIDPDFTVAPPGADMDESEKSAPPAPPDTAHINLEDGEDQQT
jgi:hypothetical protein